MKVVNFPDYVKVYSIGISSVQQGVYSQSIGVNLGGVKMLRS